MAEQKWQKIIRLADERERERAKAANDNRPLCSVDTVVLSDVKMAAPSWLWRNRILRRNLNLFFGDGGLAKTAVLIDLAARYTSGRDWPDGEAADGAGSILMVSAEDGIADTIGPRLVAAGGDPDRFHCIRCFRENGAVVSGSLQTHLGAIGQVCSDNRIGMVIIDPVMAFMGGGVNTDKQSDVRRVLSPVKIFAEDFDVAVIAISHANKHVVKAASAANGSGAFVHAARSNQMFIAELDGDGNETGRILMLPVKSNLAPRDLPGLAYRVHGTVVYGDGDQPIGTIRIEWDRDPVRISANRAVAIANEVLQPRSRAERLDAAADFIRDAIAAAGGQIDSCVLKDKCTAEGISHGTMMRARDKLGVEAKKLGYGESGKWILSIPPNNPDEPNSP